ncbi:hypothetical protein [Moraxella lacunata]
MNERDSLLCFKVLSICPKMFLSYGRVMVFASYDIFILTNWEITWIY